MMPNKCHARGPKKQNDLFIASLLWRNPLSNAASGCACTCILVMLCAALLFFATCREGGGAPPPPSAAPRARGFCLGPGVGPVDPDPTPAAHKCLKSSSPSKLRKLGLNHRYLLIDASTMLNCDSKSVVRCIDCPLPRANTNWSLAC